LILCKNSARGSSIYRTFGFLVMHDQDYLVASLDFERGFILIRFGEDFFTQGRAALVLRCGLHGEHNDAHPMQATGPRLGRVTRIEGRGELGRLLRVTSPC
jgi:hypothetical protein